MEPLGRIDNQVKIKVPLHFLFGRGIYLSTIPGIPRGIRWRCVRNGGENLVAIRRWPQFKFPKSCQGVQAAVALLIDSELWGFATPANVEADTIRAAAAKIQPYYAVPTKLLTMEAFPHTQ